MKSFSTEQEAIDGMIETVDDPCIDNIRFAFMDDDTAMSEYENAKDDGCCGFHDEEILVNGRKAMIGCNYGH